MFLPSLLKKKNGPCDRSMVEKAPSRHHRVPSLVVPMLLSAFFLSTLIYKCTSLSNPILSSSVVLSREGRLLDAVELPLRGHLLHVFVASLSHEEQPVLVREAEELAPSLCHDGVVVVVEKN